MKEVSVVNESEMEEVQEAGIWMKQRMHVSIFRLKGRREIIETKSKCSTFKEKRRTVSLSKQKWRVKSHWLATRRRSRLTHWDYKDLKSRQESSVPLVLLLRAKLEPLFIVVVSLSYNIAAARENTGGLGRVNIVSGHGQAMNRGFWNKEDPFDVAKTEMSVSTTFRKLFAFERLSGVDCRG